VISRTQIGLGKTKKISKPLLKRVLSLHELKQKILCFDEEILRFLDQRKQVKMQCLQDPNQSNIDT